MKKTKSNNGITLISLAVTIVIMMILAVSITTSITSTLELEKYNKVKEDIIILSENVKIYYMNNRTLPVYEDKIFDLTTYGVPTKDINPNDKGNYYTIDISLLEKDVSLNNGAGNKNKDFTTADLYVVNEQSLTVYYLNGASLDGERHYTILDDFNGGTFASDYYNKVKLPIISTVTMESNGKYSTVADLGDVITLKILSNYEFTQKPTIVIDGQDVSSKCVWNGKIGIVSYTVSSFVDSNGNSKAGTKVSLKIYNYTADGRSGDTITDVNFGKGVSFENGTYIDGIKIPENFYYVGGKKSSGIVISDSAADKERYANQDVVGTDLVGNQFVWIPVDSIADYKRVAYSTNIAMGETDESTGSEKIKNDSSSSNAYYAEKLSNDEKVSVEKYKGYYIGRYEAGDKESTETKTMRSSRIVNRTVTIKANQVPYNYVTYHDAIILAENFGRKYNVKTKLISSYAWDTAIEFLQKTNSDYGTSSQEGNYIDTSFSYFDITNNTTATKSASAGFVIITGQTTPVCNIYDMGGNDWEWTTESYTNANGQYTLRGGGYVNKYTECPAGIRLYTSNISNSFMCFRITMFL